MAGMKYMSVTLPRINKLHSLNLGSNNIQREGIMEFSANIYMLPSLQILNLGDYAVNISI